MTRLETNLCLAALVIWFVGVILFNVKAYQEDPRNAQFDAFGVPTSSFGK